MNRIIKKIALCLFTMIPMMVFSQTRTISGIVSDEKGQGIAYASVIIKSTKKGTCLVLK
jgi:hypothetical protein